MIRLVAFLLPAAFFATALQAAPPVLNNLYPAGVERGQSAVVTAGGTFDAWPPRAWASHEKIDVKPDKDKGKLTITASKEVPPGVYWLRLFNDTGASQLRPFVVGLLAEVMEVEPNDSFRKPQAISSPEATINGKIGTPGDVDHFAVPLKKGQRLVASLVGNEVLNSPMDAHLQIVSVDGFVLAENNDFHGLDPLIDYLVPKDGTYLVRVFAFPSATDSSIRLSGADTFIYRLTLTTKCFADHAFPLAIKAETDTAISLRGWNIPESSRTIHVKSPPLEKFWLRAEGVANPVAIRIEDHACVAEVEPNGPDKRQRIDTPVTVSGAIQEPGDVDVFEFVGVKGQPLAIRVEAGSLGSPLDPLCRLLDAKGAVLQEPPTSNAEVDLLLNFTPTVDGIYRFELRDLYRHGGWRYIYRLSIAPPQPSVRLTAADPAPSATGTVEIPLTIERLNGHKSALAFRVRGLGEGVVASFEPPVIAGPKATPVKLKLSATKPFNGPIVVEAVEVVFNLKPQIFAARTTIPGFKAPAEHVWVSLRPAGKK